MEENRAEWLSHLSNEVVSDAHGNLLDAYVVALEGWRRGLTLRWHVKDSEKFNEMRTWFVDKPGQLFSLSSKDRTHYFFRTRGDKVTNEAVDIGRDKEKTKQALLKNGVTVPEGKQFTEESSNEEIVDYTSHLGFPVVLKPTDGSFGRGVISNITSSGEFEHSLEYVRSNLGYQDVIVEQYIPGKEYRMYVVGDEVVGAMNRIPPNVTGDGVNSIGALIEIKNEERSLNPRLVSCPILVNEEVEDYIGRKGYSLDTIPEKDLNIALSDKTNISLGGDPIDALDELPEYVKEAAVKALHAVSGLEHGAVDLILHQDNANVYIIELNPTAQLGGLLYPIQGKSRDIPKAIIDYYFPETKDNDTGEVNTFFDFHDVLDPLQSRDAFVTTVTPCPQEKLFAKKYIVSGDVLDIGYHRGLRKQAFERYLHGYIMTLEEGDIEIVVGGTDPEMVDDFKNAFWEDEERGQVFEIQVEDYEEPIKVGFEIKTDLKTQIEDLKMYKQELEITERELKKAELKRRKYYSSLSWKATMPIRLVGSITKKLKN
ncbi:acylphosphatase [Oceanobacillus polygoni]|uniref:Acylphosphatase n=1 Tax=Oceanobacillus polygoni TaxID=1235259 RepID=A0A9X1CDF6_9BACI|nr:acylphosphatase [Oceanobacillus polygoni]MBP2076165.1 D-alanine-D-alanine ligase-like ATP-grasp enzyme/acylphosphatase [Oceanobacillus polygoni]